MRNQQRHRFSKAFFETLKKPQKGRVVYRDDKELRLSAYITQNGCITFFTRKNVEGRDTKYIIGNFPDLTVEQARKKAQEIIGLVATGSNPHKEKQKRKSEKQSFEDLFLAYMERHSKPHKKSWQYDEREIRRFLKEWFSWRATTITKQDVQAKLEAVRAENGLYQSNRLLERIRAIYNKNIEWGWKGENPAAGLKKYKEKSRDRFVQPFEMPYLLRSINEDENETARDYFLILILTGARKTNTLMMRWEEIDWDLRDWRIPDTKNGDSLRVALGLQAIELLQNRRRKSNSYWVFPNIDNCEKHFVNPKRAWKRILSRATLYMWQDDEKCGEEIKGYVSEMHGLPAEKVLKKIEHIGKTQKLVLPKNMLDIRIHDIRRTFGSYQALAGASLQVIGKSLGHKSQQATQIYARLNLDPIRSSIEKATSLMFGNKADSQPE